jgi:hypothetical protein
MAALTSVLLLLLPLLMGSAPDPPGPAADEPQCLAYDPEMVRLSGVLEPRMYPAAPGGESEEDEPGTTWVLRLFQPICTTGSDEVEEPESGVREVQVVVESELVHALGAVQGRPVTVSGTLFHSHSRQHHTPVLIIMRGISGTDLNGPGFRRRTVSLLA